MRRIAYASPLNPAASGISDYSEELLPYLARYVEITPYVADGLRPTNANLLRHMDVRPLSRLDRDQRRHPYDAILYHMGNSVENHAAIWDALRRVPGVVVLHEFVLHHFMLGYAAVVRRDVEIYRAEATRRYGPEGARVANLMLRGRLIEAAFDMPLCESVLDAAEGVLAHSRYVLDRVAMLRPELPAALAPMGVPLPPEIPRREARARLGLPPDALILASFGHINPYKRVEAALRAVKSLRAANANVRYLLVGSVSPSYDVHAVIARAGLEDSIVVTGYVDRHRFEDYVAAADICLNLRHPTAGETSASLLRLLGAGKPTLVSASGSFAELPPGVAAQVDLDASEGDLILAYCRLLAARPELAAAMGRQARAYVAREHTLDGAAASYMRFLATRYGWGELPEPRQGLLWEPTTETGRQGDRETGRQGDQQATAAEQSEIYPLQSAIAGVLADLGATEDDSALLKGVSRAIAELGMTPNHDE
ncbi:MAG TPA: glycosyltransferase family 4 protein [Roseiflexaceae bacterium]|nr:glycosyltransferase family 4 protein [Roseiflexaceae bacterium]